MTHVNRVPPPQLPPPQPAYSAQQQTQINNLLRLYFNKLDTLLARLASETTTSVTSDYSVGDSDQTIFVDASAGPVTITLPASEDGRVITIKKIDSTSNAVVITTTTLLDGAASQTTVVQYVALKVQGDGTNWYIL